jgi:uncharacterized membrane protein
MDTGVLGLFWGPENVELSHGGIGQRPSVVTSPWMEWFLLFYTKAMDQSTIPPVLRYFLYFSFMSFVGWVVESLFRSYQEGRWVNAGFLSGPFIPIYGFGALIISFIALGAQRMDPPLAWALIVLSPTVLEYGSAWLLESFFGLSLWDYRDEKFNLHGRICLKFSLYWALLAVVNKEVLEPWVFGLIRSVGPSMAYFYAGALTAYFLMDLVHSIRAVFNFKAVLKDLQTLIAQGGQFISTSDILREARGKLDTLKGMGNRGLPLEIRRLLKPLNAFPALWRPFQETFLVFPDWIKERLEKRLGKKRLGKK